MSGTAQPQTIRSPNYVDYDEFVDFQLDKTRANLRATEVFTTLTCDGPPEGCVPPDLIFSVSK